MNRRQKKKRFKKIYGYNPPKETRIEIQMNWDLVRKTIVAAGKMIPRIIEEVVKEAVECLEEMALAFRKCTDEVIERIEKLSEEEWEEIKKKLSQEQIAFGDSIREKKEDRE